MSNTANAPTEHLGQDLKRLREEANKTQEKIAEALTVDPSRISRLESGLVTPSAVEVDKYLQALGTPQANAYRKYHLQTWQHLPRPSFWHPDRESLRQADETVGLLQRLDAKLDADSPLKAQVDLHLQTVRHAANFLRNVSHDLVAVGDIAVGKTTGTCALLNLMLPPDAGRRLRERVVLETGSGRITLTEVVVRKGPKFGILIVPQAENEIRSLVRDFCSSLVPEPGASDVEDELPKEVSRALRNLAGLAEEFQPGQDGQRVMVDPAAELLRGLSTPEERRAEVFNRLRLSQRTTTHLWHDECPGTPPLIWLRETFLQVNNGLRQDVSLPSRIVVLTPDALLDETSYDLSLVDTKGIQGGTAIRPDLQQRLENPRNLLLLCSLFPNAPSPSIQQLIQHAWDTGARTALAQRVVLLVLARDEEALEMKDDLRRLVQTEQEGYDIRTKEIKDTLLFRQKAAQVPIVFYNATSPGNRAVATRQIMQQVRAIRQVYVQQISDIHKIGARLMQDFATAISQAAHAKVTEELKIFLGRCEKLLAQNRPVYMLLLHAEKNLHPMTVRASSRRSGDWDNLNAYLYLGKGASTDAQNRSAKFFTQLEALVEQLLAHKGLEPAHAFLRQLQKNAERWRETFLEALRPACEELVRPTLYEDEVWHACAAEYGHGFRDRVATLLQEWFENPQRDLLLNLIEKRAQTEWETQVVTKFKKLCSPSGTSRAAPDQHSPA